MLRHIAVGLLALGLVAPSLSYAQDIAPRLIKPAVFGEAREVTGDALPLVTARPGCKTAPLSDGPCLDGIALNAIPSRVLMLARPAQNGDRVSGDYGRDFTLYTVWRDAQGAHAQALALPTSNLSVPRDCFALSDEEVGYGIGSRNGAPVAVESQIVSCGGGPRAPHGPYAPQGEVIPSGADGWHVTEMQRVAGQRRYLAQPGSCDPQFSVKTDWCAEAGVRYLQSHPDEKELDLIATKAPARAGDVLGDDAVEQWVLKRKGETKFKADSRWFKKSLMTTVDGCSPVEAIRWYVEPGEDGLYITEKALNRCGAPLAPVPADTYEAYGQDMFIVDCAQHRWRDRDEKSPDGCFDQARDYLQRTRQTSAWVVVLNQTARLDDHLYDGGYISYDVARVSLSKDGALLAKRDTVYAPAVSLRNCAPVNNGPAESHGFVIARSMGVQWARPYAWMSCPVY
ncbi:MAG TPA: hypothetical protein VN042_13315 [Asticcacaulis sp.]|nr:hypothetical protein [Asticcacaulis sp.]